MRRRDFFHAIKHTEDSHAAVPAESLTRWIEVNGERWQEAAWLNLPRHLRAIAGLHRLPRVVEESHCGWWWCSSSQGGQLEVERIDWAELSKAGNTLSQRNIDPWGLEAASIAHRYDEAEEASREKSVLEIQLAGLQKIQEQVRDLPRTRADGELGVLVSKVEASLAQVRKLVPTSSGGRPPDAGRRAAIEQARALGWGHRELTAILLLTGVLTGDLVSLTKYVRQTWSSTD